MAEVEDMTAPGCGIPPSAEAHLDEKPPGAGAVEVYRGGQNVMTPHPPEAYPGLVVVRPAEWDYAVIVPEDGCSFIALGGERLLSYRTRGGVEAQGFTLGPGDRAVRVRSDLPASLAEWWITRAGDP